MIARCERLRVLFLSAIISSVVWSGALSAVQERSVLELLAVEDRLVEMGGTYEGELTRDGFHSTDDRPLVAWGLVLTRGQMATVDLLSASFDAFLYVVGPGLGQTLRDDDGAGGCNARISFEAAETGMYRVVVSSVSGAGRGRYTLSVSERPGPTHASACGDFSADMETYLALPVGERVLAPGVEVEGTLGPDDVVDERQAFVRAWALQGNAGEEVTVDLISEEFDAFLYLLGPGLSGAQSDDDGGGACHSRITVQFPETGQYRVIVSTLGDRQGGRYTLRVSSEPGPVVEGSCAGAPVEGGEFMDFTELATDGRTLEMGGEFSGTLSEDDVLYGDGSYVQAWAYAGRVGESVTVDLLSDEFDAFLSVTGPGIVGALTDDDGAGRCDSRITFEVSEAGTFTIVVSSVSAGATGAFSLRVSDVPGPVSSEVCQGTLE